MAQKTPIKSQKNLENAVLVTGAGQRVGLYLAQQFLAQGGFPVIFTYRTHHPAVDELLAGGAIGVCVDFTHADEVAAFNQFLIMQVGSLRAVIHNASLWLPDAQVSESESCFQAMFEVHVKVPYQLSLACLPLLKASTSSMKDVIAISDCKVDGGNPDYAAYLSTKAGLESLMQSFAKQFAPVVKVNTIAPGLICFNEGDSEDYQQKRLAESAIPKPAGVETLWQAVQFLMNSPTSTGSRLAIGQLPSH